MKIGMFISIAMVFGMVTFMSMFGILMEGVEINTFWNLYAKTWLLNIMVALPLQLVLVGPSSRYIFSKIYR